jgi:hypothetical protein
MTYRELPEDLLQAVDPQNLRVYALATGWARAGIVGRSFAVFSHPDDDLDQVLVPLNVFAPDYGRRIGDAVQVLAEREKRPAQEVLRDLLQADADVLRFRIVSSEASRGTLPLEEAIDLLDGAKQALLAAACSVVAPNRRHHPRLSRAEAQDMLAACRMGQTERGSFTVTVSCPIQAVEGEAEDSEGAPFVRKATQVLMSSAQRLLSSIDDGDLAAVEQAPEGEAAVTSNFCEALLNMQPPQERSCLAISCAWAPSLPMPSSRIPGEVHFRQEHFPALEKIYRRLQPAEEPRPDLFAGYVDTLNGEMGAEGRIQGEVTLLLLHEEAPVRARVDLSADDYKVANEAHMAGGVVAVRGILHRGRRAHRLTDVSDFQRIQTGRFGC